MRRGREVVVEVKRVRTEDAAVKVAAGTEGRDAKAARCRPGDLVGSNETREVA